MPAKAMGASPARRPPAEAGATASYYAVVAEAQKDPSAFAGLTVLLRTAVESCCDGVEASHQTSPMRPRRPLPGYPGGRVFHRTERQPRRARDRLLRGFRW